jgi:bleomycin hydrolase
MKKLFIILSFLLVQNFAFSQYTYTTTIDNQCTEVKSQDKTGTCWNFSTTSFLESELIRMGKPTYNLSEMYGVRAIYMDKAQNFLFRQGKANFSQGALSHDVFNAYKMVGAVPESAYTGLVEGRDIHNHSKMERELKTYLKGLISKRDIPSDWRDKVNEIMDANLGKLPETFEFDGKNYTSETFTNKLGINPDDYVTLTSFTHHPFYSKFILEIPDNYSNGTFYNLPLDEMVEATDNAIKNGYTVVWDGDVSEKYFSQKIGTAIVPEDTAAWSIDKLGTAGPSKEMEIDQEFRQQEFENFNTTDDHLMHIVGLAKDQTGTMYYRTKNSWGASSIMGGYVNISPSFFRLKTVSVLMHKDAVPTHLKVRLGM